MLCRSAMRRWTDSFTYTVSDGFGGSASSTVTISIFGNNDAAPMAQADTNWIQELMGEADSPDNNVTGNVLADVSHPGAPNGVFADVADTDADGDALAVNAVNGSGLNVGTAVAGAYGTLTLLSDGTYTYELDDANAAVNALQVGDTPLTDSFTYTVTDGFGKSASSTVTISIFGDNDPPVANADTNWIQELMGETDSPANNVTGDVLSDVSHPGAPSGRVCRCG